MRQTNAKVSPFVHFEAFTRPWQAASSHQQVASSKWQVAKGAPPAGVAAYEVLHAMPQKKKKIKNRCIHIKKNKETHNYIIYLLNAATRWQWHFLFDNIFVTVAKRFGPGQGSGRNGRNIYWLVLVVTGGLCFWHLSLVKRVTRHIIIIIYIRVSGMQIAKTLKGQGVQTTKTKWQ